MCKVEKYKELKSQIKDLTARANDLQLEIIKDLELKGGEKKKVGDFNVCYSPVRRWVFKTGRGKGLAGLIKRRLGEEFMFKVVKFDRKDLGALVSGDASKAEVDKFFDCKESYQFRVVAS